MNMDTDPPNRNFVTAGFPLTQTPTVCTLASINHSRISNYRQNAYVGFGPAYCEKENYARQKVPQCSFPKMAIDSYFDENTKPPQSPTSSMNCDSEICTENSQPNFYHVSSNQRPMRYKRKYSSVDLNNHFHNFDDQRQKKTRYTQEYI